MYVHMHRHSRAQVDSSLAERRFLACLVHSCTQNGRKLLKNKEVFTLKSGLKKKITRYKRCTLRMYICTDITKTNSTLLSRNEDSLLVSYTVIHRTAVSYLT